MYDADCPECGGHMFNIDQFGLEGVKCDTCYLIIRPWGEYDRSDMEEET
ncbi:MAG: hypothetical protein K2J67_05910 [Lachnospiraceae bacterium]|nr:hypothetical protein [Lachnospiraceae bacterium]